MMSAQKVATFVIIVSALGFASPAHAVLIFEDGFDYGAGAIAMEGGQGWAAGSVWSGSAQATAPGLTYPNITNVGANKYQGGSAHFRDIDTTPGSLAATAGVLNGSGLIGADDTTVWMSFIGSREPGTWGGVSLFNGGGEEHFIGNNGGGDNPWLVLPYNGGANVSSTVAVSTEALILLRFDFTAGVDTTRMWVSPDLSAGEPALGTEDVLTTTGAGQSLEFNRVRLATGSAAVALTVDELRMGTTFNDMASVPEPSTLVLAALGLLALALFRHRRRQ